MMESVPLTLRGIAKRYGTAHALKPTSLDIEAGEMLALLGPSGCGKTTMLRIIAGFTAPDTGQVLIGNIDVTDLAPNRRGLGMVFQSYSLFPHMTVGENIAYGLKMRGINAAERAHKVRDMLDLVRLPGFEDRQVNHLSGGQQQRVALARSLVTDPKVLLLDEPLGALDRQLRENMQFELRAMQKRLGITTIIVTHDQEEALTVSDRIAVMQNGEIVQTGAPTEIYERPRNRFVSEFLGTVNIFDGDLVASHPDDCWSVRLALPGAPVVKVAGSQGLSVSKSVRVAVRPERLRLNGSNETFRACIRSSVFRGSYHAYELDIAGIGGPVYVHSNEPVEVGDDGMVGVAWPQGHAVMFGRDDGR
ncbi:putative spermidine/putrescine transport system ATP-binding protein [Rhizobium sp. NFR07]|uniref:ABC transporter ATP-binding protein n=1 Tax=Rhizobium sp. NFR07 TaxID=1566262 RepID=UPI0008EF3EB4|nr:ABC transporter ATP-binding protein [Rhizobium sp. NFR07]SFB31363.1 putative spermidine/putrescine transport system ATP-binding protein [Rhizobium sp. NFR07]